MKSFRSVLFTLGAALALAASAFSATAAPAPHALQPAVMAYATAGNAATAAVHQAVAVVHQDVISNTVATIARGPGDETDPKPNELTSIALTPCYAFNHSDGRISLQCRSSTPSRS